MKKRAFTLIEILIVVAVLGILAAIVVPQLQDYSQQAKESNAKANLRILREVIERYAVQHDGVPPGYAGNNINSLFVFEIEFYLKMLKEGYLPTKVKNPFNGFTTIKMVKNNEEFPTTATGAYGWIYKPLTKTIKIDSIGTDTRGELHFNY